MGHTSVRIASVGSCVPDNVVTNADLARFVDTSDEWITTRTGIKQRYLSPKDAPVSASELGTKAAARALEKAGLAAADVDAVICATFTPDYFFPSTACRIQDELGCTGAFAFDISAACTGFIYGLTMANSLILSGQCRTVVLVGSEIISRALDWTDRTTCILFGDAAGAAVLTAGDTPGTGILSASLGSNGSLGEILFLPAWGEHRFMKMKGNEVFKHAVRLMSESVQTACGKAGVTVDQLDYLVPHQANVRIINGLAGHLGVAPDKVVTNIERYGNTSSASIPLALEDAMNAGKIKAGSLVALTALGGGITMGSAIVRF